jgi:hypothetical protein
MPKQAGTSSIYPTSEHIPDLRVREQLAAWLSLPEITKFEWMRDAGRFQAELERMLASQAEERQPFHWADTRIESWEWN